MSKINYRSTLSINICSYKQIMKLLLGMILIFHANIVSDVINLNIQKSISKIKNQASTVLIMTQAYNRPDFIEWQYKTLKKFLKDDFEYVVFNDARDINLRKQITQACSEWGINHCYVPQDIHKGTSASSRHAEVIQFSLNYFGYPYNGLVWIIDCDLFLIKKFSIVQYMQEYDIASYKQERADYIYLWPGIVCLNVKTLPHKETLNWAPVTINGISLDTGGYTYYYLKNNPEVCVKWLINNNVEPFEFNARDQGLINKMKLKNGGFLHNAYFFHYGGVSWLDQEDNTGLLFNYFNEILSE